MVKDQRLLGIKENYDAITFYLVTADINQPVTVSFWADFSVSTSDLLQHLKYSQHVLCALVVNMKNTAYTNKWLNGYIVSGTTRFMGT